MHWFPILVGFGLAACESAAPMPGANTPASGSPPAARLPHGSSELDPRFVETIRAAAPAYRAWGRVDDLPRVAPAPCAAAASPRDSAASQVRLSAANHGPHGKKLYYLWASDRDQYRNFELPTGFTIVKESFVAVPDDGKRATPRDPDAPIDTLVTATGERLAVGERKDLFVMVKVGAQPGSDEGWIYGTIATDGTVTSAGRVASCMGCHDRDATHERLFGLAPVSSARGR